MFVLDNETSGVGSNNSALGQGSVGDGNKSSNAGKQGVEGGAGGGGRESDDKNASIGGDTVSQRERNCKIGEKEAD